eukprot:2630800-Prymnesium_polylepis.1
MHGLHADPPVIVRGTCQFTPGSRLILGTPTHAIGVPVSRLRFPIRSRLLGSFSLLRHTQIPDPQIPFISAGLRHGPAAVQLQLWPTRPVFDLRNGK